MRHNLIKGFLDNDDKSMRCGNAGPRPRVGCLGLSAGLVFRL